MSNKKLLRHKCKYRGNKDDNCRYCNCNEDHVILVKSRIPNVARYVHLDCFIKRRRQYHYLLNDQGGLLSAINSVLVEEGYVKPYVS